MTVSSFDPETGWPTAKDPIGINGRGVKRAGATKTVGGRTVVSGTDVSNQAVQTTKD